MNWGGNACQIQKDQRSLQNRNLLGIVWNCGIKLIHRKSSISFTAFFSSLLPACLCKWHEYREILSQTCLWISWHNTGIVETIRKSVEDKSFATKKLEQKEEHQGMLHKKFLHLPNESGGFVAYLCYRASWQPSQRKGIVVLSWWKALGATQPREQISQASSEKNRGEASALTELRCGQTTGDLSTFSLKVISICKLKLTAVWAEAVRYDWKLRAVLCLNVDLDV